MSPSFSAFKRPSKIRGCPNITPSIRSVHEKLALLHLVWLPSNSQTPSNRAPPFCPWRPARLHLKMKAVGLLGPRKNGPRSINHSKGRGRSIGFGLSKQFTGTELSQPHKPEIHASVGLCRSFAYTETAGARVGIPLWGMAQGRERSDSQPINPKRCGL